MESLNSGKSPGSRIDAGDDLHRAAAEIDTELVAKKLASFRARQAAYVAADKKVKAAVENEIAQERLLGAKDAVQDEDVDTLASKLAGDGLPRTNPFKPFGAPAPSVLKITDAVVEAETIVSLTAKIAKRRDLSKDSQAAATKACAAAKAVSVAAKPLPALRKKVVEAMAARESLAPGWEKAFSVLKRAARAAEDDGAPGIYEALFLRGAPKATGKKRAAKKGPDAKPAQPTNGAPANP